MATVGLTFSPYGRLGASAAVLVDNESTQSEVLTSVPGSSVPSTIEASTNAQVCRVAVTGAAVWVTIAETPVAAEGTKFLVLDGTVEYFVTNVGDKVAVFETA